MAGPSAPTPSDPNRSLSAAQDCVTRHERKVELIVIMTAVAVAFVLRWAILLRGGGYPPSEDAAGDLYNARLWLTGTFHGTENALLYPPVYYFAVVIPLVTILPPLSAVEVMMALVPALVIIPAHFLLKRIGVLWPVALITSFVLATSSAYSNMISWNSAYNMFGIVLIVAFFYSLFVYLDAPNRRNVLLASAFFSLVIGSHELSAVVLIETTVLFLALVALVTIPKRQLLKTIRTEAWLAAWILLFSLPWWPIYIYSYIHTTNVGYSPGLVNWTSYLMGTISQPWAGGSGAFEFVGEIISLGAIVALAINFRKYLRFLLLLVSLFVASVSVAILDSQNAVRGLPFLPVVFVLAMAPPISDGLRRLLRHTPESLNPTTSTLAHHPKPWRRSFRTTSVLRLGMITVCIVALLGFAYANTVNSESVFQASSEFFSEINPHNLAVMQWLDSHTPVGSTVYVPSPTLGWARYYDRGQNVIGPYQLQLNVITNGLDTIEAANEIYMGAYSTGSPYITASMNYPGVGTPTVWIGTPGNSFLFGASTIGQASVNVIGAHGPQTLYLSSAHLLNVTDRFSSGTLPSPMILRWHWSTQGITLAETLDISGQGLSITWSSETPAVWTTSASYMFVLPPTNTVYHYTAVEPVSNGSTLKDTFTYTVGYNVAVPFGVQITPENGTVSQTLEGNGFTDVNSTFDGALRIQFSGLIASPVSGAWYFANATKLLESLNVSYLLVDSVTNYAFYSLFANLSETGYARAIVVDQSGSWYAFSLSYG